MPRSLVQTTEEVLALSLPLPTATTQKLEDFISMTGMIFSSLVETEVGLRQPILEKI